MIFLPVAHRLNMKLHLNTQNYLRLYRCLNLLRSLKFPQDIVTIEGL